MDKCLNCGYELTDKYCSHCGQERPERLETKTILKDITHIIIHWDASVLKTFKCLVKNPGLTVKNYIIGIRKSYIKPFSYFMFIQTLFVLIFHRWSGRYFTFVNLTFNSDNVTNHEISIQLQHLVGEYVNYLNYFLPLILALYLFLFLKRKTGINYAEALAGAFYWVGTTLIFSVIIMILALIEIRIWFISILVNVIFYVYSIINFSGLLFLKGLIKGLLITLLSYFTYIIFVVFLMLLYLKIFKGISFS
jgi:hypothetical protein